MTVRLAIIEFHESLSSKGQEFPQGELCFKLVETYQTSDGMRSRLCDGLWASKDATRNEMRRRLGLPEGQWGHQFIRIHGPQPFPLPSPIPCATMPIPLPIAPRPKDHHKMPAEPIPPTPLPEQVTLSIKGITFQLLAPYVPGQPLGVAEAGLLNKEWTQNVRLAFQPKVEAALAFDLGEGLTHAQIASLQLDLQHFADEFAFKALPQARNGDQLTRTKHAIARRIMDIRLNSDGLTRSGYGEHRYESALARLMNNPEVIRQAQQQISASREAANEIAGMEETSR